MKMGFRVLRAVFGWCCGKVLSGKASVGGPWDGIGEDGTGEGVERGLAEVREVFEVGGFGDFEGGVDLAVGVAFGDHAADQVLVFAHDGEFG